MSTLRIGMIGAGRIAAHNCNSINAHPDARVVAVADSSRERGEALQNEFAIESVHTNADDLLADDSIDAVSIAVPNAFHAPLAIAALRAGKHVMLDKPFTTNYPEAVKVAEVARETGLTFMVSMNMRFRKETQTVKAMIGRGDLGDIYHAKAYWLRRSGIPRLGTWFGSKKLAGGGVLLDIGVHLLDLALYLMDNFEIESVSGITHRTFGHRGLGEGGWGLSDRSENVFDVEDFAGALIRLKNGTTLNLEVAWAMHQPEDKGRNNVEIFGSEAALTAFDAKLCRFGPEGGEYQVTTPEPIETPHATENRFLNWIDVILGKAEPVCTLPQALAVQRTLNAIYRSAETGREVTLAEIADEATEAAAAG